MDYLAKVNQIEKEEKTRNISISVKSEISACRAKEAKEAKEVEPSVEVRNSVSQGPPQGVTIEQENLVREQGGVSEKNQDLNAVVLEPAALQARPVFWERNTGEIVGPAQPEFLARVGTGATVSYWVVAQFEGHPVWINSIRLRSQRTYESQVKPTIVELIHEVPLPSEGSPRGKKQHHREGRAGLDVPTLL